MHAQQRKLTIWILALVAVILAVALLAYLDFSRRQAVAPPPAALNSPPVDDSAAAEEPPGPRYPVPYAVPDTDADPEVAALPRLEDAADDATVVSLLGEAGGFEALPAVFKSDALVAAFVATVDALPGESLPERLRPWARPAGEFVVRPGDDPDVYYAADDNADRYARHVDALTAIDPRAAAAAYRDNYPVLQQAWRDLGDPDGHFNDRVIDVVDHLLGAPLRTSAPALLRPNVLYQYRDPELEAASVGQKFLLRLAPDDASRVLDWLQGLARRTGRAGGAGR